MTSTEESVEKTDTSVAKEDSKTESVVAASGEGKLNDETNIPKDSSEGGLTENQQSSVPTPDSETKPNDADGSGEIPELKKDSDDSGEKNDTKVLEDEMKKLAVENQSLKPDEDIKVPEEKKVAEVKKDDIPPHRPCVRIIHSPGGPSSGPFW